MRRVIYASSHHAVGFYRRARFIDQMVVPRPDGVYGVSKVFGDAVGRLFADKHGLSVACLRIGAFRDKPADRRLLHVWLSTSPLLPKWSALKAWGMRLAKRNGLKKSQGRGCTQTRRDPAPHVG